MATNTMHSKVINFFNFLADTYLNYFSDDAKKDDTISAYIRHIGDDKADFKKFQFGYLAIACNNEKIRPKIEAFRNISYDQEKTKIAIDNIRGLSFKLRTFVDRIDAISDNELKELIVKFSRYANLFTMLYFLDPVRPKSEPALLNE